MVYGLLSPAMAETYPKVLFGSLPQSEENERSFEVTDSLLQIQLTSTLVISAGKGAMINLFAEADSAYLLTVNGGAVIALELESDRVIDLPPGAYRIGERTVLSPESSNGATDYKQGFALADYYMVRQQSYLDSLHIDVRDINQGLVSLLHHLFPGQH